MFKFKKRAVKVSLIDDQPTDNPIQTDIFEGPRVAAAYAEVVKDVVTHAAITIGGVYVFCKIVERICK